METPVLWFSPIRLASEGFSFMAHIKYSEGILVLYQFG